VYYCSLRIKYCESLFKFLRYSVATYVAFVTVLLDAAVSTPKCICNRIIRRCSVATDYAFGTALSGVAVSPPTMHLEQHYQALQCRHRPCIWNSIIRCCSVATYVAFVTVLLDAAVSAPTMHLEVLSAGAVSPLTLHV